MIPYCNIIDENSKKRHKQIIYYNFTECNEVKFNVICKLEQKMLNNIEPIVNCQQTDNQIIINQS